MRNKTKVSEIINYIEEIDNEFKEITELSKKCKFSNCTHTTEPDCEVKKAISDGTLSEERFNYYYRIKHEAEYVSEQKNKTKAIDYMRKKKMFERP